MKRYIYAPIPVYKILLLGLICFNCVGKKSVDINPEFIPKIMLDPSNEIIEAIPNWYTDIPVKAGFRYHVGTDIGRDEETVTNNAEYYASENLALELESEILRELNHALHQMGKSEKSFIGKALKRAGNKIITKHAENYAIVENKIQEVNADIGSIYCAYILIEWDEGPAQQELLYKIKKRDNLYAKLGETDLLEKMEAAVEAYNKKQEFFGSLVEVKSIKCENYSKKIDVDKSSN